MGSPSAGRGHQDGDPVAIPRLIVTVADRNARGFLVIDEDTWGSRTLLGTKEGGLQVISDEVFTQVADEIDAREE